MAWSKPAFSYWSRAISRFSLASLDFVEIARVPKKNCVPGATLTAGFAVVVLAGATWAVCCARVPAGIKHKQRKGRQRSTFGFMSDQLHTRVSGTKLAVASLAGYWTNGQLCAFAKWGGGGRDDRGCHRLVGHIAFNPRLYAPSRYLKLGISA